MRIPGLGALTGLKDRRKSQREQTTGIKCALGRVVDLSQFGMCVEVRRNRHVAAGKTVAITLEGWDSIVAVRAQVVWHDDADPTEPFYRVGFRFVGMNDMSAELIGMLIKKSRRG